MRQVLSVSIDSDLNKRLAALARKHKISKSGIVKAALRKYVLRAEFLDIAASLEPMARKAGYYTDEDVFRDIS